MNAKTTISKKKAIMDDWDFDANTLLNPEKLTIGSNKTAAWVCSICSHKWTTTIYHRATRETGCPNCLHSKRKNYNSTNSLSSSHPDIAINWHPTLNNSYIPEMFTKGSRFKANWKCARCGYEWQQKINGYTGCKSCKHTQKLKYNNLADNHPKLMKEWDYSKNKALNPNTTLQSSTLLASWACGVCNYKWNARINNRTKLGRGCPCCAGKVVIAGKNDLKTTAPQIAKEWNYKKNGNLSPVDVSKGLAKKVWWTCPYGHDYKASILHRGHGANCPECNSGRQTSFAEQATYFYVKQLYPDAVNRFKADFLGRMELDIYIPSIKYAIEYDGEAWHNQNTLKREQKKYAICKNAGIKLIRLREEMPAIGSDIADVILHADRLYKPKILEKVIYEILRRLNFSAAWLSLSNIDVNIERDYTNIQKYRCNIKDNSLATKHPEIAKQWHDTKNGDLTPLQYHPGSSAKVWWICLQCKNEYKASIGHRVNGTGCPKCAIEKVTESKRKAVNMIDPITNQILSTFQSISDAGKEMKISNSNITMVCKGVRKKAGGFHWEYSE